MTTSGTAPNAVVALSADGNLVSGITVNGKTYLGIVVTGSDGSFVPYGYNYVSLSQNPTQDIWTYRTGGSGGTIVGVITITYTDNSKSEILSAART